MLGMKSYPREYIEQSRARVAADLATYRRLVGAMVEGGAGEGTPLAGAVDAFEVRYFNGMVLQLDYLFVHRLRMLEGKDGSPLNEVRALCNSLLLYGGVFTAESSIKLVPAKTVLKHEFGDEIELREADFVRLCDAFFAEIDRKFSQ